MSPPARSPHRSATSTEAAGPFTSAVTTPVGNLNADLGYHQDRQPDPVNPGAQLTYAINVTNNGPNSAANAVLDDNLPAQLGFVSLAAPAGWSCTTPAAGASGNVHCTNAGLANGATAAFTLVTTVAAATPGGSTMKQHCHDQFVEHRRQRRGQQRHLHHGRATLASSMSVAKVLTGTVDNDGSSSVTGGDQLDYQVTATNTAPRRSPTWWSATTTSRRRSPARRWPRAPPACSPAATSSLPPTAPPAWSPTSAARPRPRSRARLELGDDADRDRSGHPGGGQPATARPRRSTRPSRIR
jgi:uncharacterized repeat protein (TIGR01451 family)